MQPEVFGPIPPGKLWRLKFQVSGKNNRLRGFSDTLRFLYCSVQNKSNCPVLFCPAHLYSVSITAKTIRRWLLCSTLGVRVYCLVSTKCLNQLGALQKQHNTAPLASYLGRHRNVRRGGWRVPGGLPHTSGCTWPASV